MNTLDQDEIDAGVAIKVQDLGIRLPKGRGLSRMWGPSHWAFRDVGFSLKRGETIAVMGRNGSGKSTLLRTLAGIIEPNEGKIARAPGLSSVILAPGAGFDKVLTGVENLYNAALYMGHMREEVEPVLPKIIAFTGLEDWINEPVGIYSAGMKARLGFALAIHFPADILMIDETLSAGDAEFRDKASAAVHELIESDRTVVLVSHNLETLRSMCTQGLVLDRGRQIAVGGIDDMLEVYDRTMATDLVDLENVLDDDAVQTSEKSDENDDAMTAAHRERLRLTAKIEKISTQLSELQLARVQTQKQRLAKGKLVKTEREDCDQAMVELAEAQKGLIGVLQAAQKDKRALEQNQDATKLAADHASALRRSRDDMINTWEGLLETEKTIQQTLNTLKEERANLKKTLSEQTP